MNKKEELVSIVIPVYNVEKYLDECIQSAINQTYKNIEVIIINDGSTDNCDEICKKYQNYDKVIYISKKNEGVSVARNIGMEKAKGKWIMFVDGDDYMEDKMVEKAVDQIKKDKTDVVITPPIMEYDEETRKCAIFKEEIVFDKKNMHILEKNIICRQYGNNYDTDISAGGPWGKIYNLDFLRKHKLHFIKGLKRMQDVVFNLEVSGVATKISYRELYCYHYRINSSSVCIKYNQNIFATFLDVINHFYHYLKTNNKDSSFYQALYLKTILLYIEGSRISVLHKDNKSSIFDKLGELKSIYKIDIIKEAFKKVEYNNLNNKLKIFVLACNMHLFALVYFMISVFIKSKLKEQG